MRLAGKGSPSPYGGPPGDLFLIIKEEHHPVFTRDGNNLIIDQRIPYTKACLGSEISVKSLEGKELKVKVPPGIQPQSKLRLKGHGLPTGKTGGRGDIYVRINVDIPKGLTDEQKKSVLGYFIDQSPADKLSYVLKLVLAVRIGQPATRPD